MNQISANAARAFFQRTGCLLFPYLDAKREIKTMKDWLVSSLFTFGHFTKQASVIILFHLIRISSEGPSLVSHWAGQWDGCEEPSAQTSGDCLLWDRHLYRSSEGFGRLSTSKMRDGNVGRARLPRNGKDDEFLLKLSDLERVERFGKYMLDYVSGMALNGFIYLLPTDGLLRIIF
jgi:hypothetical protein